MKSLAGRLIVGSLLTCRNRLLAKLGAFQTGIVSSRVKKRGTATFLGEQEKKRGHSELAQVSKSENGQIEATEVVS